MTARAVAAWVACMLTPGTAAAQGYDVEPAFPRLSFEKPVDLQDAGDGRLFVVEQNGVIRVFRNDARADRANAFLDVTPLVSTRHNEMGLLGLAFHPDFKDNGELYVYYTASTRFRRLKGIVSRFRVDPADPDRADPSEEEIVLEVGQPWGNHNGGQIAFGPDGYLYVGLGDGGSAGDPEGNGQNRRELLGSILRIDVSDDPYAIPADNPFAGNTDGYKEEIYAYGLRNPWRFSFDRETGELWCGDVGQVTWEEVNLIEPGLNYGWDCYEGSQSYEPAGERSDLCADANDLRDPVIEYGRELGQSITGGYVYRGARLPALVGAYIYADYSSGRIWAIHRDGDKTLNELLVDSDLMISSFGIDAAGEVYICDHDYTGTPTQIYRLTAN